jgi:hypothetical protein
MAVVPVDLSMIANWFYEVNGSEVLLLGAILRLTRVEELDSWNVREEVRENGL